MRIASVDSETLYLCWRRYRSKLCLFYLLWSYSPSYPSRLGTTPTSFDLTHLNSSRSTLSFPSTLPQAPPSSPPSLDTVGVGTPQGITASTASSSSEEDERSKGDFSPTPPFDSSAPLPPPESELGAVNMQVVGSTEGFVPGGSSTPPLSPPPGSSRTHFTASSTPSTKSPPSPSAPSSPASSNLTPPISQAASTPASDYFFTPFTFSLALLHILFLVQFCALPLGDSLVRHLLSSPLPPSFPSATAAGKPSTAQKRWTRFRWRAGTVWRSCGASVGALMFLVVVVAAFVGLDLLAKPAIDATGTRLVGWNLVPLGWLRTGERGEARLRVAGGFAATQKAAKLLGSMGGPWRWVVGVEVLATLLTLLHSLAPLFLSLNLLPSSTRLPTFLATPPPLSLSHTFIPISPSLLRRLRIPLPTLLSTLLALSLPLLTLLQTILIFLARYQDPTHPAWRRWLSFSTLVLAHAVIAPLDRVAEVRERAVEECTRVGAVIDSFGADVGAGREGGEDWVCSICFEGRNEAEEKEEEREAWKGWASKCRLPCGHCFHASHLSLWLSAQSFCPTCHRGVSSPSVDDPPVPPSATSPASSPTTIAPSTFFPPPLPPQPDYSASFPGAAAMRRREREGGRRTVEGFGVGEGAE